MVDDPLPTESSGNQTIDRAVQEQFDALTAALTPSDEAIFLPKATSLLHIGHIAAALGSDGTVELLKTGMIEWVWFKPKGVQGLYARVHSINDYVNNSQTSSIAQRWAQSQPSLAYDTRLGDAITKYRKQNMMGGKTPVFYFTGNNLLRPMSGRPLLKAIENDVAGDVSEVSHASDDAEPNAPLETKTETKKLKQAPHGSDGKYMAVRTYLEGATVKGRLVPPERYGAFLDRLKTVYNIEPVAMEGDERGSRSYFRMSDVLRLEKEGITPPQTDSRAILTLGRQSSSTLSGRFPSFDEKGRS